MKATRTNRRPVVRSGFTLLELLIVLGIIVAIAAMVAPNLLSSRTDANNDIARATIKNIEDAFKRKALKNNGVYPPGTGTEPISDLAEPWEDSMGKEQKLHSCMIELDLHLCGRMQLFETALFKFSKNNCLSHSRHKL